MTPLLSALFRRLFPGPLGAEVCEELDRQYVERRARRGAAVAWLVQAAHVLAPSTWRLALELRRRERARAASAAVRSRSPVRVPRRSPARFGVSLLDVKLGLRMLVKHPGLTLVSGFAISVSIAIGVGCFGFFQDFFTRPSIPLPDGDRIVSLGLQNAVNERTERRLLHDFSVWRDELESIEDVSAWRDVSHNLIGPDGRAEPVRVAEMTASGFRVAGVPPLLGRPLLDADEVEGAPPVVVIGYDVWRTRFGGEKRPGDAGLGGGQDVDRNLDESSCGCEPHPVKA